MIRVSTRVSGDQTAAWIQVVREASAPRAAGFYRIQFGTGGHESAPEGSVDLTPYDRGEIVKALGGVWVE
jgi:hypothetical protein